MRKDLQFGVTWRCHPSGQRSRREGVRRLVARNLLLDYAAGSSGFCLDCVSGCGTTKVPDAASPRSDDVAPRLDWRDFQPTNTGSGSSRTPQISSTRCWI